MHRRETLPPAAFNLQMGAGIFYCKTIHGFSFTLLAITVIPSNNIPTVFLFVKRHSLIVILSRCVYTIKYIAGRFVKYGENKKQAVPKGSVCRFFR